MSQASGKRLGVMQLQLPEPGVGTIWPVPARWRPAVPIRRMGRAAVSAAHREGARQLSGSYRLSAARLPETGGRAWASVVGGRRRIRRRAGLGGPGRTVDTPGRLRVVRSVPPGSGEERPRVCRSCGSGLLGVTGDGPAAGGVVAGVVGGHSRAGPPSGGLQLDQSGAGRGEVLGHSHPETVGGHAGVSGAVGSAGCAARRAALGPGRCPARRRAAGRSGRGGRAPRPRRSGRSWNGGP